MGLAIRSSLWAVFQALEQPSFVYLFRRQLLHPRVHLRRRAQLLPLLLLQVAQTTPVSTPFTTTLIVNPEFNDGTNGYAITDNGAVLTTEDNSTLARKGPYLYKPMCITLAPFLYLKLSTVA